MCCLPSNQFDVGFLCTMSGTHFRLLCSVVILFRVCVLSAPCSGSNHLEGGISYSNYLFLFWLYFIFYFLGVLPFSSIESVYPTHIYNWFVCLFNVFSLCVLVTRLRFGRRSVNLSQVAHRTNALTNGVDARTWVLGSEVESHHPP